MLRGTDSAATQARIQFDIECLGSGCKRDFLDPLRKEFFIHTPTLPLPLPSPDSHPCPTPTARPPSVIPWNFNDWNSETDVSYWWFVEYLDKISHRFFCECWQCPLTSPWRERNIVEAQEHSRVFTIQRGSHITKWILIATFTLCLFYHQKKLNQT